MKFVSFDIETATVTPEGSNPHDFRPLGICCAATQEFIIHADHSSTEGPVVTWKGPHNPATDLFAPRMEVADVHELIDYLASAADDGYFPLGWNSLSFDFDILAEESFDLHYGKRCANLALSHFDPAFQQLCVMGYMIGMQAAAIGMGCRGKLDGMHGDLAPQLWARSVEDQKTVLAYVSQDVQTTTDILRETVWQGKLRWTAKSGRVNNFKFGEWKTVDECLKYPIPDVSWMSEPRTRLSCYSWMKKYLREEEWKTLPSSRA